LVHNYIETEEKIPEGSGGGGPDSKRAYLEREVLSQGKNKNRLQKNKLRSLVGTDKASAVLE